MPTNIQHTTQTDSPPQTQAPRDQHSLALLLTIVMGVATAIRALFRLSDDYTGFDRIREAAFEGMLIAALIWLIWRYVYKPRARSAEPPAPGL